MESFTIFHTALDVQLEDTNELEILKEEEKEN
jgi:hypothetical protein